MGEFEREKDGWTGLEGVVSLGKHVRSLLEPAVGHLDWIVSRDVLNPPRQSQLASDRAQGVPMAIGCRLATCTSQVLFFNF